MATNANTLREWRVSIMRDKVHYLGRVVAPDREAAIVKAMEEFRIEPARAADLSSDQSPHGGQAQTPFRLIVVPVE